MKKKSVALVLALALVVVCIVGGTLAWLTATTTPVVNTFTTSDINITLEETGATNNANSYQMIPGYTITKDPKVTVKAGSQKCYLFVKLEKSANFDDFLTYEIADGWDQLKNDENQDVAGVFYRTVDTNGMGTPISVLKNDQVAVNENVTKAMMSGLNASSFPTLKVTAYASQFNKNANDTFSAFEAWNNIR